MSGGVKVRDAQGQQLEVGSAEAQAGIAAGRFEAGSDEVLLKRGDNRTAKVDRGDLGTALAQGWEIATEGERSAATMRREESGVGGTVRGSAEALARGASLGVSDAALGALGADTKRLKARQDALGDAGTGLEVLGGIAATVATGGTGGAAQIAGRGGMLARSLAGAGRLVAAPSRLAARAGLGVERALLGSQAGLGRKVVAGTVGGAVDGALGGLGGAVSESVLADKDLTGEAVVGSVLAGAAFGGAGSGAGAIGEGALGRILRGAEVRRGGAVPDDAVRDVLGSDVGLPSSEVPDGLLEAGKATDGSLLGSAAERFAFLSGTDPAVAKRVFSRIEADPSFANDAIARKGQIEDDVANTFQDGFERVQNSLKAARMASGGEAKYKALAERLDPRADFIAPRVSEQMLGKLNRRLGEMDAENAATFARSYDVGAMREVRKLVGRADAELRGTPGDSYSIPPRQGLARDANILEEQNIVGPVAREELGGAGLRKGHQGAYKGATPEEVAAIAEGRMPTKNRGKVFEPIRVIDNGPNHGELNLPRYTIRDGHRRAIAAEQAGAQRVSAVVELADDATGEIVEVPALVRVADGVAAGSPPSAAQSFRALDRLKRDLGEKIADTGGWSGPPRGSTTDVIAANKAMREMYGEIKDHLERRELWGDVADSQREINAAYAKVAKAERAFKSGGAPGLKRLFNQDGTISKRQAITLARQYQRMGGGEVVDQLDEALQAQLDYLSAVQKNLSVVDGDSLKAMKEARSAVEDIRAKFASQRDVAGFLDDLEHLREAESARSVSMGVMSSLGPTVGAILGGGIAGPVGAAAGAAAGGVTRPYTTARSMASLMSITGSFGRKFNGGRLVGRLTRRLKQGAPSLRSAATRSLESARAAGRGGARAAAFQVGKGSPAQREEQARRVAKRVQSMSSPEAIRKALGPELEVLEIEAPETAAAIEAATTRAATFLQSKAPSISEDPYTGKPGRISARDVDRWLRYRGAVVRPAGVVDRVLDGTVTREDMEAINAVYPKHAEQLKQQTLDAIADAAGRGKPVPYEGRLRLSRIMDIPLDQGLTPERIASAQARMAQSGADAKAMEQPSKPRAAGVKDMDMSDAETATDRIESR